MAYCFRIFSIILPKFCVSWSQLMDRDDDKYIVFRDKYSQISTLFNINWQNLVGFSDLLKAFKCFFNQIS